MTQEFKPGDKVRFIDTLRRVGEPFWPTATYTVNYVRQDGLVVLNGIDIPALAKRFELIVEPEPAPTPEPFGWAFPDGKTMRLNADNDLRVQFSAPVPGEVAVWLTQDSGQALDTQPEDETDPHDEPEPLKEDSPAFNDDDVQRLKVTRGSTVLFDGLAVFTEADNGNVTVTPVPRCTSLFLRHKSESDGGIVRCGQHEGHDSNIHWTIGMNPATSWPDNREYARITEGGAS